MLKIIVADDERAIRESISACIDWKGMDLDLVGVYANGVDTYDAILNESPDIVMTDIKMPGMDGLELIERIAETDPDTQFIILSGYGEFSYAQRAMKYGVRHYLLKPCSEEQIENSLREAIQECCKRRAISKITEEQKKISHSLDQSMFINILTEASMDTDGDHTNYYLPWYKHVDFTHTKYLAIFLKNVPEDQLQDIYDVARKMYQTHAPSLPFQGIYGVNNLLLFSKDFHLEKDVIPSLKHKLKNAGYTEEIALHVYPNLSKLMDDILDYSRFHGIGALSFVTDLMVIPLFNYKTIMDSVNRCCTTLCQLSSQNPDEMEDIDATIQQIKETLINQLQSIDNMDFLIQLATNVLFTFADHDLCCSLVEATEIMLDLKKYQYIDDLKGDFLSWLNKVLSNIRSTSKLEGKLIQEIKDYIQENLSNPNLTLKMIAENYLYMNVDYVSKRFFKETGVKFSMYLREVRIQKAKELIAADDSCKLQNIAESVGLGNNPQYFSQVFKKQTGMTPSAYSKKIHGRE